MRAVLALLSILVLPCISVAQDALGSMLATEKALIFAAEEHGSKRAFSDHLTADSVVFRPRPINGRQYLSTSESRPGESLVRKTIYADISANGLLGYTTGNWRMYQKGKSESAATFGQYVTIWQRQSDGRYRAVLDIATSHDKLPFSQTDYVGYVIRKRDPNKRGWSPADASIDFQRLSMTGARLGGAYEKYAARDVRLLIEREPPVVGKRDVVREMKRYIAVEFPTKVTTLLSADMAYTWNPCRFANNDEGLESGNCLHIWKLRDKEWQIVLGVFARLPNETPPVIRKPSR